MKFLEWLDKENKTTNKDNIFAPPLEPQMALDFLCDYLLGEDWYSVNPISQKQINTEIVGNILYKYSKRYRKELKEERDNRSGRRSIFAARFISCSKRK